MLSYAGSSEVRMKVAIQVPATMANLGCGFDCLGLALPIYNTVIVEETVLPGSGVRKDT